MATTKTAAPSKTRISCSVCGIETRLAREGDVSNVAQRREADGSRAKPLGYTRSHDCRVEPRVPACRRRGARCVAHAEPRARGAGHREPGDRGALRAPRRTF